MTGEREPDPKPEQRCCGGEGLTNGGAWVPREGEQQVPGCMLCSKSGRYWRDQPT